jgi:DNA polymerase III gamma/tau subunit
MSEELHRRYRPKTFKQVFGQEKAVRQLTGALKGESLAHQLLFTGPSGCGKTSLARILKEKLNCSERDFKEVNCADFRGIDMVRDIRKAVNLRPLGGTSRIWLVDECFHKDTLVDMRHGSSRIADIRSNDIVHNINGESRVLSVFHNKIALDRIVKLTFNDGTTIYTTKQHKFLTQTGWVEAQNLDFQHSILCNCCYPLHKEDNYEDNVRNLWAKVSQKAKRETSNLLSSVWMEAEGSFVRDTSHLAWKTWGQWTNTISTENSLGQTGWKRVGLENGVASEDGTLTTRQIRLPILLQSGHWKDKIQTSHRDRWEWTSHEKRYIARCQKDKMSRKLRVDRVEVYQRGCNESSFLGVITNQEKNQGFAEFYDLEIEGHPSYFVEGIPVHNCHKMSSDAQAALLKMLEEPPSHVYFFLATTDPQKLIKTIQTRCTEVQTIPMTDDAQQQLIAFVLEKEGKSITDDVRDKIIECAEQSARKALVILQTVLDLESEEEQLTAILRASSQNQAIQIARSLMNPRTSWPEMVKVLKSVDEDPEGIRRLVLAYASNTMLGANAAILQRAYLICVAFSDNFFDTGRAGLVSSCYEVVSKSR